MKVLSTKLLLTMICSFINIHIWMVWCKTWWNCITYNHQLTWLWLSVMDNGYLLTTRFYSTYWQCTHVPLSHLPIITTVNGSIDLLRLYTPLDTTEIMSDALIRQSLGQYRQLSLVNIILRDLQTVTRKGKPVNVFTNKQLFSNWHIHMNFIYLLDLSVFY